jgi:hypothetical protein
MASSVLPFFNPIEELSASYFSFRKKKETKDISTLGATPPH